MDDKKKVEVIFEPKVVDCQVYTLQDIQKILGDTSVSTAGRIMRQVKAVSDVLGISGLIHKYDWDTWLEYRAKVTYKKGLPASAK